MKTVKERRNDAFERVNTLSQEAKSLIEKVEKGEANEEEMNRSLAIGEEMKAAKAEVEKFDALIATSDAAEQNAKAYNAATNDIGGKLQQPEAKSAQNNAPKAETVADEFIQSEEFQGVLAQMKQYNGQLPQGFKVNTRPVQVKTLVTTAPSSFGNLMQAQRLPNLETLEFSRPLTLLSLINRAQATSDTIEYPRHSGYVNNAATVAQATATTGASGQKPESEVGTITVERAVVQTIAHWIPISRQALQDIPALRNIINTALTYGLQERLQQQILSGLGTGTELQGLLNTGWGMGNVSPQVTEFHTIRKSITEVRLAGRANPNAIVINPLDWEKLEMLQDTTDNFYSGSPFRNSTFSSNLYGVPVITDESIPVGKGITGDFSHATLWESLSPTIFISDSHADTFTRNIITLLAEMRVAFAVTRPKAFCTFSLV